MADADVRLATVSTGGTKLSNLMPDGAVSKEEGRSLLVGKWQIPQCGQVSLTVSGNDVRSVEAPFGNQQLMAEIDDSEDKLGLHITMGGFPMKAWMEKRGGVTTLMFSNGGKWSKV